MTGMKKTGVKRAALSAALITSLVLGGCGGQKAGGSAAPGTKNAEGKYDPVLTIKIAKQLDENAGRYGNGEDINKNPMVDLAVEKLGIRLETT